MEKHKFVRRGVYKKATTRKSPDNTLKKGLQDVQEIIGQLREIKSAEKFNHKEDLRSRLRKSMLVREVKNIERNIISSTPHHTKDPSSQPFFGTNLSILLSPISQKRYSSERNEPIIEEKKKKSSVQVASLHHNEDISNEVDSNNINNLSSHIDKENDLLQNDQSQQKLNITLRRSKRDRSINKSKIYNGSVNKVNSDLNKSKTDKSLDSSENSLVKGPNKSPEKKLPKSSAKETSSAQGTAVKKSKIPLRTASQEKEKASEVNNNLHATRSKSLNKDHEDREFTPRKRVNISQVAADNVSGHDEQDLGDFSKNNESINNDQEQNYIINISSTNSSADFEENDNDDLAQKSSNNGNNIQPIDSAKSSNDDLVQDRAEFANKTPRRRNNETLQSQTQLSPLCSKNAKVRKIIITQPEQHSLRANCNKSRTSAIRCQPTEKCDGVSAVLTRSVALSPLIGRSNKRRVLQTTRLEKSVGVQLTPEASPNNSPRASESTHKNPVIISTPHNKTGSQTEFNNPNPLGKIIDELSSKKTTIDKEIQTSITAQERNKNIVTDEDDNTNPLQNIIAEIETRKSLQGQKSEASISRPSRRSGPRIKLIRLEEDEPPLSEEVPVVEENLCCCKTISFPGIAFSDTDISSGCGSDLREGTYNYVEEDRHSNVRRFQIFESLEEENTLDALDFSEPEPFNLHDESVSNMPWRFVDGSSVPEIPLAANVRDSRHYSYDNGSSSSSFNLRHRNLRSCYASGRSIHKSFRGNTTLTRTTKRQYNKKTTPKKTDDQLGQAPSPTFEKTVLSTAATISDGENPDLELSTQYQNRKTPRKQGHQPPEVDVSKSVSGENLSNNKRKQHNTLTTPNEILQSVKSNREQQQESKAVSSKGAAEQTFISKASKRSKKDDKDASLSNNSVLVTENTYISLSSTDQQLLGVRPLSDKTSNKESRKSGTEQVNGDDIQAVNLSGTGHRRQLNQKNSNKDPGISTKENTQQLDERPKEVDSNNDRSISLQRPRSTKKRGKNNNPVKPRSTLSMISHCNILPTLGEGRPQRTRKPVRYLTDIIVDEELLKDFHKKKRKLSSAEPVQAKGKKSKKVPNTSRDPKPTQINDKNATTSKRKPTRQKKTKDKPKQIDKQVPFKETDEIEENLTENIDKNQGDVLQQPEVNHRQEDDPPENCLAQINGENATTSKRKPTRPKKTKDRRKQIDKQVPFKETDEIEENLTENIDKNQGDALQQREFIHQQEDDPPENCLGKNPPSHHEQASQPTENKDMPPPNGSSIINSVFKLPTRRRVMSDSGFETTNNINNTNNKTTRSCTNKTTRSCTNKKSTRCVKTPIPNVDDTGANADHGSQELLAPESVINSRLLNPAGDVAEQIPRTSQSASLYSRDFEGSDLSSAQNMDGERRLSSLLTDNNYVTFVVDDEQYNLRFCNNLPSDSEYTSLSKLKLTQTVKYPKDKFSCGHIRIPIGSSKKTTLSTKYALVYSVAQGTALVSCQNRSNIVEQGGYTVIPVGIEYSIRNVDPQSELVMSYAKIKV